MEKTQSSPEKTEPEAAGAPKDGELTRNEKEKLVEADRSIYISYDNGSNSSVVMTATLQKNVANSDKDTHSIKRLIQSGDRSLVAMCDSTSTRDKLLEHLKKTAKRWIHSNKTSGLTIERLVGTRPSNWFISIGAANAGSELLGDLLAFWRFHTGRLPKVNFQVRMVQIQSKTETGEAAVVWNSAVPFLASQILIGKELKRITIQSTRICNICGKEYLGADCITEHSFKTLSKPYSIYDPKEFHPDAKVCVRIFEQATRYERYNGRDGHEKAEGLRQTGKKRDIALLGFGDTTYLSLSLDSDAEEPSEKKRKVN